MAVWMLPAAMAAGGAIANAYGGRKARKAGNAASREFDVMGREARGQHQQAQAQAQGSRNQFQSAVQGFDPTAYMQQQAGALHAGLSEQMGEGQAARAASLNRRGLFRSDIGGAGMDRDFNTRLSQGLAGMAGQAAGMEQNRHAQLGQIYGMDQGQANQYYNAATGLQASGIQGRHATAQQAAQGWSDFGSGLASGAGAIGGAMMGAPTASVAAPTAGFVMPTAPTNFGTPLDARWRDRGIYG